MAEYHLMKVGTYFLCPVLAASLLCFNTSARQDEEKKKYDDNFFQS